MDGRASGGIVMAIIVTGGARTTVFGIVSMLESPNGYVVHFYTYVVFIFTLSISTLGFIYIPLVSVCVAYNIIIMTLTY